MRIIDWSSDVCASDLVRALNHSSIRVIVRNVTHQIGLRRPGDAYLGPRIHDLRHSYAVATLLRWYRAGDDVEQRLPILSTYLGHSHTSCTYWYLSACPELMEHAARRLDARWEQAPRSEEHTSELQSLMRNSSAVLCLKHTN